METQSPKISFYVKRRFSEKLDASFNFIKENWKTLLKYTVYLMLPLCLLQAVSLNSFLKPYMAMVMSGFENVGVDSFTPGFIINYGLTMLFYGLGMLLMTSLVYALVKLYNDREERLGGMTFGILKPLLFANMGRLFIVGLCTFAILVVFSIVVVILAVASVLTLIVTIPAYLAFLVALALWFPVYLFEDISIRDSFIKAMRLGFGTWGGVFGTIIVMALITSVIQGVFMMPYYITFFAGTFLGYASGGVSAEPSAVSGFFTYIFGVIMFLGMYLSMVFGILGLSYQYGHASEKIDSVTVESDIDNFANL